MTFHPKMKRLLDELGERKNVLDALYNYMNSFGWSGSFADYSALYDKPMEQLENHKHVMVRRWAKKLCEQLRTETAKILDEDDEFNANWGI